MKKNYLSLLVVFACSMLLFAGAAMAQTEYTYPADAPVLSVTFPEGWTLELDKEDQKTLTVTSKDEGVLLYLWPLDEEAVKADVAAAIKAEADGMDEFFAELLSDTKFEEPEEVEINGFKFSNISGTAKFKDGGADASVSVTFFATAENKLFAMVTIATPDTEKANEEDLGGIVNSIKNPSQK